MSPQEQKNRKDTQTFTSLLIDETQRPQIKKAAFVVNDYYRNLFVNLGVNSTDAPEMLSCGDKSQTTAIL